MKNVIHKLQYSTIQVRQSLVFAKWLSGLRDAQASKRIAERIFRLSLGNPGQRRTLKAGVCELKIDYGPGYRVYYTQRGNVLVILLCGGDKRSQKQDIETATRLATEV